MWPAVIVGAGLAATVLGLVLHDTWRQLPAERFLLSLLLAALSSLLAWGVRRLLRCSFTTALAGVWLLALIVYVGPLPVIGAGVLGAAALALGLRLLPDAIPARAAVAATIGMVVIAGVGGWIVTLPIHFRWVWAGVLTAMLLWQRKALRNAIGEGAARWQEAVALAPRVAACCVLLLGLASTACWIPTMQADDLSYHLNLPMQLLQYAQYQPQAEHQVWSYAPWAGDFLHGIVFVLSGRDGHGALNAMWLVLAAGSAWSIAASLTEDPIERWASVALFASFPPLVWMAAGMQTELAATAATLALAAVVLVRNHPGTIAAAILAAGLFALKLVHGIAALPLLVLASRSARPHRLMIALGVFVLLATSSYVQAWIATGNPFMPLFNDVFQSPDFPAQHFRDERWHSGFGPALPWQMTFDTRRFVEAFDGGIGFTMVALAGAWLLSLRRARTRALCIAATAALLITLMPMQYARYAYPAIALLCALLPAGLRKDVGSRLFRYSLIGVCVLNLAYQANAGWLHHTAALKRTIRSGADPAQVWPHYVPERMLVRMIPQGRDELVLATDPEHNNVAELAGRGRTVSLHDPSLMQAAALADRDASGVAWAALLDRERIRWALVTAGRASPALRAGLARADAVVVDELRGQQLWRIRPALRRGAPP
jgi:hypothetical protein